MNLGGPVAGPHEVDRRAAQAELEPQGEFRPRHSSGEPSNDRGAKGVAERESGQ